MLCVTQNVRSAFSHKILNEYTFGSNSENRALDVSNEKSGIGDGNHIP